MPEAHNGFSLSAATEARGVMLELNAAPGFDLVCYQLFRQNVDEEAPAGTPVTPEVTSEPEGNGPIRLLDASIAQPGRYIYRMVIFVDCVFRRLSCSRTKFGGCQWSDVIYLPLVRDQLDP